MIRKISGPPVPASAPTPCYSIDHDIPMHMVFEPGTYEHKCSGCGKVTVFTIAPYYLISDWQVTCGTWNTPTAESIREGEEEEGWQKCSTPQKDTGAFGFPPGSVRLRYSPNGKL